MKDIYRNAGMASVLLGLLLMLLPNVYGWEAPVEPPRVRQSFLTAVYLPSFGLLSPSALPLYDNFFVDGNIVNLFPRGMNLSFYYGVSHTVKDAAVFPESPAETAKYLYLTQASDTVYGRVNYVFYDYFQLNGRVDYLQNQLVWKNTGFDDYNMNRLTLSGDVSYDIRYSSIENYFKGKVFLFPEEGWRVAAGIRYHSFHSRESVGLPDVYEVYGGFQSLFHLSKFWVLSLTVNGESHLNTNASRTQFLTAKVNGASEIPGNYNTDLGLEIRFLQPIGLFWESPEFWYINSFLFKFSPGFAVGYNAGLTGNFRDNRPVFQNSVNLSPLVAVRMNGDLISVLRFDFIIASSSLYRFMLSFNFNTGIDNKPAMIARIPVN